VVAVSRALAGEAEALGVPPENIRIVQNGVDGERFRPADRRAARSALDLPLDQRILLYVGHLKESKGLLDLATAFARLAERVPDAVLVVVGDGEVRSQLASALAPLGERVRLVGVRPHDEVPRWMAAADVVVLPSWNEGTPNAVIEALASGRPVVATRVGGVPDLVTGPLLGELVPPRNPPALAAALERALSSPSDPDQLAAASARPSWRESAAALHAVLEEALP
jgi:glycosyltransferase involved in cell wall biosynthesis